MDNWGQGYPGGSPKESREGSVKPEEPNIRGSAPGTRPRFTGGAKKKRRPFDGI